MKKKKKLKKQTNDSLIFLNRPIDSEEADWIGVSSYVNKVHEAVEQGAEMIAITSSYGSGKSSVIELLKTKITNDEENEKKYHFIKVNLWSHSSSGSSPLDLHKSLIYQIVSQIYPWKGSYITKHLSKNFGLLKLTTGSRVFSSLAAMALLFAISTKMYEELASCPAIWVIIAGYGIAISLGIFLLFNANILFSYKESAGNRNIDENEILDLYRSIVWKYRKARPRCCKKNYVIIIEDLDRTDDDSVPQFLKELRKYCLPYNNKAQTNSVCFIVNVKPEALLNNINNDKGAESFYSKVFDFVIDLRTVNIDNYDTILEGLMEEKRTALKKIGVNLPDKGYITRLKRLQWIIRGKELGIREIKERLNFAFLLYASLVEKFGADKIDFRKCVVASYVINRFPKDFYALNDWSFTSLLDEYYNKNLKSVDDYKKFLPDDKSFSDEFIEEIKLLIEHKHIDSNYRTYFYNYPKGSKLYSIEENAIWDSIVYRELPGGKFNETIESVSKAGSNVIFDALKKVRGLELTLPEVIFTNEILFSAALQSSYKEVLKTLEDDFKYDDIEIDTTVERYKKLLSFSFERKNYPPSLQEQLCEIWEKKCTKIALLKLRLMICTSFANEVLMYISLFYPKHPIIRYEELSLIDGISTAIELLNANLDSINIKLFTTIHEKVMNSLTDEQPTEAVENFYISVINKLNDNELVRPFIDYMTARKVIIPELEDVLYNQINQSGSEQKYITKYITLINTINADHISMDTLINIQRLGIYSGFSAEIRQQLYNHRFYIEYIFSMVNDDAYNLNLDDYDIQDTIESERESIYDMYPKIWTTLRLLVTEKFQRIIDDYIFMFADDYPYATAQELANTSHLKLGIKILNYRVASENDMQTTADFFNKKRRTRDETFEILQFISKFKPGLTYKLFYLLNMHNIQYKNIAKAKREQLLEILADSLSIHEPDEILKFISHTGVLDESLEKELSELLRNDDQLRKGYVDIINYIDKPTATTISNLLNIDVVYSYSPKILHKLFERKAYTTYIESSTLKNGCFKLDEDKDILWSSFITILKSENEFKQTKDAMSKNKSFLAMLNANEDYINLPESSRMFLSKIPQDKKCIVNIMTYSKQFIEQYFAEIVGFHDKEAAELFVEEITSSDKLLRSQIIYDHTHPRLIDPVLKSKYTRARNKLFEQ